MPVRVGLIGAGKLGISHLAITGAHPDAELVAVCDSVGFVLSAIKRHTGVDTFKTDREMLDGARLDAVIVATGADTHFACARAALERNLHVFVERPLTLSSAESRALSEMAIQRRRVAHVAYPARYVATFREARRLARHGAIGTVTHMSGVQAAPIVTKEPSGTGWRPSRSEGSGCLHDFASQLIDLANFVVGPPSKVSGARFQSIFSRESEDAVFALLAYPSGMTAMLEANWSDDSLPTPVTRLTLSGTRGKIIAERAELKVFLKSAAEGYPEGWSQRSLAELQAPQPYYLKGEEFTAQLGAFFAATVSGATDPQEPSFAAGYEVDRVIELIVQASQGRS